jgi:hypothetical protein
MIVDFITGCFGKMKSFKKYNNLDEALITVGKKPYPKFDNVVILAGGAGSGKGFVKSNLIAIDAKVFDVDELKTMMLKLPKLRQAFKDVLEKMYKSGKSNYVPDVDDPKVRATILRKPKYVSALHLAAKNINLPGRVENKFFADMINKEHKPNIIFDITLDNIKKLHNISHKLTTHGYKKENIHIIWIVNDIKVAIKQNADRPRVVPEDILISTHKGAAHTMAEIVHMGNRVKQYIDGDIIIVPNKRNVDSRFIPSKHGSGGYFIFADYYKIKEAGNPINIKKLTNTLEKEIKKYVPKGTFRM